MERFLSTNAIKVGGLGVAAASAVFLLHHFFNLQFQRRGEPKMKWSWLPWLGFALELGASPFELLSATAKDMGEIFGMVVAGNRLFIISDPRSHSTILRNNKNLSVVEFHNIVLTNFFGLSQKSVQGHAIDDDLMRAWYSKHLYSDTSLEALTLRMQTYLLDMMSKTKAGEVTLMDSIGRMIFEPSVAALFNADVAATKDLYPSFVEFDKVLPAAIAGISVSNFSKASAAREVLAGVCENPANPSELIQKRWAYFSELLASNKVEPKDPQRYQMGMLWAGVGNTMPTMFWLTYYILRDPKILSAVINEIVVNCGGMGSQTLTMDVLGKLVLIDACITETLRLSSGSMIMRFVTQPCELTLSSGKTYSFRKGDRVGLFPQLAHMDPEIFAEPHLFVPSRWLVGDSPEALSQSSVGKIPMTKGGQPLSHADTYLPFGGGLAMCPGRRFARNEIKTLLVYLLSKFDVSLLPGSAVPEFDGSRCGLGIFPPKKDIPVRITPRTTPLI